jgi:hypothetical protein
MYHEVHIPASCCADAAVGTGHLSHLQEELHGAIQEYREQLAALTRVVTEHPGDEEAQQVCVGIQLRLT